jgi:hypothetical protein
VQVGSDPPIRGAASTFCQFRAAIGNPFLDNVLPAGSRIVRARAPVEFAMRRAVASGPGRR